MQDKDIQNILRKVEELKAVFTFGVRFVPFLEDMFMFVKEMAPMLSEMSRSIQESSSKMPKAVQQLDKVTSATEMATHEILDKVDDMLSKLGEISASFQAVSRRLAAEREAVDAITGHIEQLLSQPAARRGLSAVFEDPQAREQGMRIKEIVDRFLAEKLDEDLPQQVEGLLEATQGDAYDIMNSLQVQDITTQQIEAAHSMLYSIQERLNNLILKYSEAEPPVIMRKGSQAFDAEATVESAEDRQKLADSLSGDLEEALDEAAGEQPEPGETPAGQEQIDALFEDQPRSPTPGAYHLAEGESQSQEEIDRLLSGELGQLESEESALELPELEDQPEGLSEEELRLPGEEPELDLSDLVLLDEEEPAAGEPAGEPSATEESAAGADRQSGPEADGEISINQEEIDRLFQ